MNDKGKENKRVEEVIITLELANKDPMNVMEVLKIPWEHGNYAQKINQGYHSPAGFEAGRHVQMYEQEGRESGIYIFPR